MPSNQVTMENSLRAKKLLSDLTPDDIAQMIPEDVYDRVSITEEEESSFFPGSRRGDLERARELRAEDLYRRSLEQERDRMREIYLNQQRDLNNRRTLFQRRIEGRTQSTPTVPKPETTPVVESKNVGLGDRIIEI